MSFKDSCKFDNCVCFSFHLENVFPLLTGQDLSSQGDVMLTLCKETGVIIVALNMNENADVVRENIYTSPMEIPV